MGRKLLLAYFCLMFLVACGGNGDVMPTAVPPADMTEMPDSPRITETPEPLLPPTWTPEPAGDRAHLPGVTADEEDPGAAVDVDGTPFIYVVQAGDTLAEIAAAYGVTVSDLATLNEIEDIDRIEVGQQLIIPISDE